VTSPAPGLFLTGTDTGVGKTFVGGSLAAWLSLRGRIVGVAKPYESGTQETYGEPADARFLARCAGLGDATGDVCVARYRAPLAPGIAAWEEGAVDPAVALAAIARVRARSDVVLVEGAGGLLVPLAGTFTVLGLARAVGLPVLVVAANRLGAINHVLLTLRVLEAEGLPVAGVVLNNGPGPVGPATAGNPAYLRGATRVPVLGPLPAWNGPLDREALAAHLDRHVDVQGIPGLARSGDGGPSGKRD
jgi:dethiobiotin synthetase